MQHRATLFLSQSELASGCGSSLLYTLNGLAAGSHCLILVWKERSRVRTSIWSESEIQAPKDGT